MTQDKLLNAIGGLDEGILAESEEASTTKPKRILWRVVIVAATLAMLTIGVAAADGFFQFINPTGDPQIGTATISWKLYKVDENGVLTHEVPTEAHVPAIRVSMSFPTNEDAPMELETPYMIQVPEHWVPCGYSSGEYPLDNGTQVIRSFSVSWEPYEDADGVISVVAGETIDDYVTFHQYSAYFYNMDTGINDHLETFHAIPSRVELSSELVTLAGIPVLKVTIPAFDLTELDWHSIIPLASYMDAGEVHLYWSDGDSIMRLTYPAWMTDDEIAEILSTIYVVEDLEGMLAELSETE